MKYGFARAEEQDFWCVRKHKGYCLTCLQIIFLNFQENTEKISPVASGKITLFNSLFFREFFVSRMSMQVS